MPVFLSAHGFEESGLAACLGLGIHPVAPYLRPLPVLVDNARCMLGERGKGVALSAADEEAFDEHCAALSRMAAALAGVGVNERLGYLNDRTVEVTVTAGVPVYDLAEELRRLNGESARLLDAYRAARGGKA